MQLKIFENNTKETLKKKHAFNDPSFAKNKNSPIHRWVPWIAGFSSEFVRNILKHRLTENGTVLDPFAGVGTTLVEAQLLGHDVVGFELNPYPSLVSNVKLNAVKISLEQLKNYINKLNNFYRNLDFKAYKPKNIPPAGFRTRREFYSPLVLKKVLAFFDFLDEIQDEDIKDLFKIAFASTMVSFSNYSYEPSLGTRNAAGKKDIINFKVFDEILFKLKEFTEDIHWAQTQNNNPHSSYKVIDDSFFEYEKYLKESSIDIIITSPPYLNNYHYIRNTRPHLYWLGFVEAPTETKYLETENFGKYWQTVRGSNKIELNFPNPPKQLIEQLEILRNIKTDKGVYGGNGWANYATEYFNDCYKFTQGIKYSLKEGGSAFVVLGNSILQGIQIPTDVYFAKIAETIGLKLIDIDVPRSERVGNSIINSSVRVEKAQNNQKLYESVVEISL